MGKVVLILFRTLLAGAFGAIGVLVSTPVAAQHPAVDRGRSLLEEADFQGALAAFDEAERASDLGRPDLIRLVEGRALAHLALAHDQAVARAMGILASLDPEHEFSAEAPPEAREHFARALAASAGPIRVDLRATPQPGGVAIAASVENDPGSLARTVRISARTPGSSWTESDEGTLTVQADGGARVDYFAVAFGPGGAPLARAGTQAAPLHVTVGDAGGLQNGSGSGSSGGTPVWIFVGAGAAAVGVVVAVVLIASSSGDELTDRTNPNAPVVVGF